MNLDLASARGRFGLRASSVECPYIQTVPAGNAGISI